MKVWIQKFLRCEIHFFGQNDYFFPDLFLKRVNAG